MNVGFGLNSVVKCLTLEYHQQLRVSFYLSVLEPAYIQVGTKSQWEIAPRLNMHTAIQSRQQTETSRSVEA